ncbi:Unknown protein, partial [Striga hermonthica]
VSSTFSSTRNQPGTARRAPPSSFSNSSPNTFAHLLLGDTGGFFFQPSSFSNFIPVFCELSPPGTRIILQARWIASRFCLITLRLSFRPLLFWFRTASLFNIIFFYKTISIRKFRIRVRMYLIAEVLHERALANFGWSVPGIVHCESLHLSMSRERDSSLIDVDNGVGRRHKGSPKQNRGMRFIPAPKSSIPIVIFPFPKVIFMTKAPGSHSFRGIVVEATSKIIIFSLSLNLFFLEAKSLKNCTYAGTFRITSKRGRLTFVEKILKLTLLLCIFQTAREGNRWSVRRVRFMQSLTGIFLRTLFLNSLVNNDFPFQNLNLLPRLIIILINNNFNNLIFHGYLNTIIDLLTTSQHRNSIQVLGLAREFVFHLALLDFPDGTPELPHLSLEAFKRVLNRWHSLD